MKEFRFESLSKESGVEHVISGRDCGAPLDFSLALHTGEPEEQVLRNREELRCIFGEESRFVSALQVHGNDVYVVETCEERGWKSLDCTLRADALVTQCPGVVLSILTADCVPILLYAPHSRAVAAVHAGWRGCAQAILPKTVETMSRRFGVDPQEIIAGIGPAVGACCYEVGEEMAETFRDYPSALLYRNGSYYLDLKEICRFQLISAGLREDRIETSPFCTACSGDDFFSYRGQEGCSGRFASCIMLRWGEGSFLGA